jgi:hypothetical protein
VNVAPSEEERASRGRGPSSEEAPPLLGSWRNLYLLLLVELAALVAGFAALTWWAS